MTSRLGTHRVRPALLWPAAALCAVCLVLTLTRGLPSHDDHHRRTAQSESDGAPAVAPAGAADDSAITGTSEVDPDDGPAAAADAVGAVDGPVDGTLDGTVDGGAAGPADGTSGSRTGSVVVAVGGATATDPPRTGSTAPTRPTRTDVAVTVAPAVVVLRAGAKARAGISLTAADRRHGAVQLSVQGLPPGVTATLAPARVRLRPGRPAAGSTLVLVARRSAPPAVTGVTVVATSGGSTSRATLAVRVVAAGAPAPPQFRISAAVGRDRLLAPGVTVPVNLTLVNPNRSALAVSWLGVTLRATSAQDGCPATVNYAVTQFSGRYRRLVVPAGGSRTLADLGIPRNRWPALTMLDLPVNQDACKGATVQLTLAGDGSLR